MKTAKVVATFDGLVGGDFSVDKQATASTPRSAISRALANVLKSPELKHKRIQSIHLDIELSNNTEEVVDEG